jgi:hypothetical protein
MGASMNINLTFSELIELENALSCCCLENPDYLSVFLKVSEALEQLKNREVK